MSVRIWFLGLVFCLLLSGCSGPAVSEASGLTVEEAREALSQALLERTPSYQSYDRETGFAADGLHYVWGDLFWNEDVLEGAAEDTEIYCFDLCFGPDADSGQEANPMAGRLAASYGIGKDGESLWFYRQDLGEWEPLPEKGTGLTAEEARETLAQALLERSGRYSSYDREAGFEADGRHYVWGDLFWNESVPEDTADGIPIYYFELVFGPDASGDGLLPGGITQIYGVGKDNGSLWQYPAESGVWEPLPDVLD